MNSILALALVVMVPPAEAGKAVKPLCGKGALNCVDAPFAGGVTPSGATIWTHLNGATTVRVRYQPITTKKWLQSPTVATADASGNTAAIALSGLASSTTYVYQLGINQANGTVTWSPSAWFRTLDAAPTSLAFSVLADFANKLVSSPALRSATSVPNDFVLFIGDMDHRGPASGPDGLYPPEDPDVLADMRNMHQNMRNRAYPIGADFSAGLLASTATHAQTPFYYAWDDHDYCANNEDITCPSRDLAFQAYRENYVWSADSGMNADGACLGDYQRISYGGLLDVFMLDARSNRDTSADTPTMLGACQLNWLLDGLRNSTATWKFIMTPVPFNMTTKTYDAWGGFPDEHQQIVDLVTSGMIPNVVVMSGDIHSGGAFDDGTHSGLPEFAVPHANMPDTWVNTYCRSVYQDQVFQYFTDEPGTWTLGSLTAPNTSPVPTCLGNDQPGAQVVVSTDPPYPLDGVGSAGYVRVVLDANTATVSVLGMDGTLRNGVYADGTAAPLSVQFSAQQPARAKRGSR